MEDQLKQFKCHKVVAARPMNLGEYNKHRGWDIPEDEEPTREGYLVVYDGGQYQSWSPKEVFEEGYLSIDTPGERMEVELSELQERIQKLEKFFGLTDAQIIVGREQFDLMVKQLNSMRMYRGFLVGRKELMCKNL